MMNSARYLSVRRAAWGQSGCSATRADASNGDVEVAQAEFQMCLEPVALAELYLGDVWAQHP
eukprot:838504-Lingulodinium_polyedra.AAC.1